MKTLDMLLADIGGEVNVANPLEVMHRISAHINYIFERIGTEYITSVYQEAMYVKGHSLILPSYVLGVEGVGLTPEQIQSYQITTQMVALDLLSYRINQPGKVDFPNYQNGKVWVWYTGVQKAEDGTAIIPDSAYEACREYALGQLLRALPLHPRHRQYREMMGENTDKLVAQARIELAKPKLSDDRTQRKYLGGQQLRH